MKRGQAFLDWLSREGRAHFELPASQGLTVRRVLASGELGPIAHFESHFDRYRPQVRPRWRERAGPGSGLWYDLGPHLLDQALQLFGLPPPFFMTG